MSTLDTIVMPILGWESWKTLPKEIPVSVLKPPYSEKENPAFKLALSKGGLSPYEIYWNLTESEEAMNKCAGVVTNKILESLV